MANDLQGKKILIFQQRRWALRIGHFLAKKLSAEGARLAAIVMKKSIHDFVVKQQDVKYELIINQDEAMENPKKFLEGDDFSLAEICRDLGIDSIWPLIATERTHVKSYRDKAFYGFRKNVSDEEMADYAKAVYKYIKLIFENFQPDLIIVSGFVALPHIMLNLYAARRGVRVITVTDCKIKGLNIFTHDYNESTGPFYERVDELNNHGNNSANRDKAKAYIEEFRRNYRTADQVFVPGEKLSPWKRVRRELSPLRKIWQWYATPQVNHFKNLGIQADWSPPRIILRDHFAGKRYRKFMEEFNYYPLEKLGKFVYFPLQMQPEATIEVMAPYFSNQIETARLVAQSLPDDHTLAVKEHPAMVGRRSSSYIEKIARTPNVKLIDYRVSPHLILQKASLVVSPSSTTIVEAAFYRVPAIQLGNLGTTLKLPNAFKHTDLTTLSRKIKELLETKFDGAAYEEKLLNFVTAAFDTGFEFNYWGVWERAETDEMTKLWQAWKKEIESCLALNKSYVTV